MTCMYRDQEQRDFARQLRNGATPAEKLLWSCLRAEQLGVKFRRAQALSIWQCANLPGFSRAALGRKPQISALPGSISASRTN